MWLKGKDMGTLMARYADPAYKVWCGGLHENTTWKELQAHMNQAGKTLWVEVFSGKGKGTAAVIYESEEAASKAVETLHGSELDGEKIVVDAWVLAKKDEDEAGDAAAA